MISIFLKYNTEYRSIINQGTKFALSIGVSTISGIAQSILRKFARKYRDRISQMTGLERQRISDIRRVLRSLVLILNLALLFKVKNESLSQFAYKNIFWIAIEIIIFLKTIEPFHSCIENFHKTASAPGLLKKIGEKTSTIAKPLLKLANDKNSWLYVLKLTFLEEFIFRAILQEGLLRQLPKLGLKVTKLASPEMVDSPISKITRISISSLIFGLAHTNRGISFVTNAIFGGISYGYIHENIGLLPAILAHFDVDFYCELAR